MDKKHIEYNEIDDENIYIPIAEKHNIASMPFGEINGKFTPRKDDGAYICKALYYRKYKNIFSNFKTHRHTPCYYGNACH